MKKENEMTVNNGNELIGVENIYQDIRNKIITAREKMFKHIDNTMTEVYWYVGKITYELSENSTKASYGKKIIDALSFKLTKEFGSGFSSVSIRRMRKFYEIYPIWSAVPTELSWSHFQELIRVDRKEEREFYEQESIKSNWGYRELARQINTKLYDRYLISPDKNRIINESKKGVIEREPKEILKSPYIFEFAGLKENKNYLETDLESALLSHLTLYTFKYIIRLECDFMNKYNIKELAEKLERCRNVNLGDVKLEDVDEITDIKIDRRKPSNERILDFIMKVKNPYIFKVNGKLVRIRFSENSNLTADDCLTNVLKNLYR